MELFDSCDTGPASETVDIEDIGGRTSAASCGRPIVSLAGKRKQASSQEDLSQSWRDVLGPPPPMGKNRVSGNVDLTKGVISEHVV